VDIPGATNQVLEWSSATMEFAGEYRFIVASTSGDSVISQIATVDVDPTFIQIIGQPLVEDREASMNAVWFDYDRDGWLDLLVPNHLDHAREPRPRSSLYRNQGDGTFVRVTSPLAADLGGVFPVVCADFDNDGHTDVFMAESLHHNGYRGHIFLKDGSGLFQALPHNLGAAFCAAARDIDGDGWVDLVLFRADSTWVYRNLGEGQFERPTTMELGALGSARATTGSFVDFDNDGRPDLHLPTEGQPGRLLRNLGGFAFDPVQAGSLPGTVNNIGSAWADYDNDGFFDLLAVSSAWGGGHAPRLHRNVPHPTDPSQRVFEDVSASSGLLQLAGSTFGLSWGDFNNDGYLDLFLARFGHLGSASTNTLMINQGDGTFVSADVGTPLHLSPSFSAHWGDYDNDGFLDLFVPCGGWTSETPNFLFRNNLPNLGNQNRWLKVQLDGRVSNRSGIGAVLRLRATVGGREMWQTRQIASNGNTWGQGPELLAHFGLGDAQKVDILRIEWPSGIVQELTDLDPNQSLTIVETQSAPPTQLPTVTSTATADGFQLTVTCPTEPVSNLRCVLEGSHDLVTWTKVMVRANENGTMEFSDPHAANHPKRFYRVVAP
jgi:hypothetical protein